MSLPIIRESDSKHADKVLARFYADDMIPAEKKKYMTDLRRSQGPYLAIESENGEVHYMMDAASQIATLGLGFSPAVFMGTGHFLESWLNINDSANSKAVRSAFDSFLKRKTGWKKITTVFCNSGAEANETALGLCYSRRRHQGSHKVLAFEGSFHGRMLISLASTWNKSKREPFQWPGYETEFSPYPELDGDRMHLECPQDWRKTWQDSPNVNFKLPTAWKSDPILQREAECLDHVRAKLAGGEIYAIVIEPMQCEGGDRYSSDRFHTGLLLMARSFEVPVIYDEVQTGFHLGREFFWHRQFHLHDENGEQLNPDFVVCAKKAQVGMVITPHGLMLDPFEDREEFCVASMIRGYLHAVSLDQAQYKIHQLEERARAKLEAYCNKFKEFVTRPRTCGISFAYEIHDKEIVNKFINERFNHGLLYYPAGEKTLRFRLNTSFSSNDIDFLFEQLELLSRKLFLGEDVPVPESVNTHSREVEFIYGWQELIITSKLRSLQGKPFSASDVLKKVSDRFKDDHGLQLQLVDNSNFCNFRSEIEELQKKIYEPARQTPIEKFERAAAHEKGTSLALTKDGKLVAIAFSAPPSLFPFERGLRQDPYFNDDKTLYVLDTTIDNEYQGHGLGRQMKYALTLLAATRGNQRIHGRNRDRMAASMLNINLSLGSHELMYLSEDYQDHEEYRDVFYYTSQLVWDATPMNLSRDAESPLSINDLNEEYIKEQLPYITNKLCLSNFVSERFMNHLKAIFDVLPKELRHGYSSSGQAECVDKIAKAIWYNHKKTCRMLTFDGHYFGNGSFLSRCLSSTEDDYFPVDTLPHPTEDNYEALIEMIDDLLNEEEYLAVWIEPLPQLLLERVPRDFLVALKKKCKERGIFLIYNETASGKFAWSENHYFACNDIEVAPDAGMAFLGGQAGIVFMQKELWLGTPLMLISTWDGDEFSFANYHRAMDSILKDPKAYLKTCHDFDKKLTGHLEQYQIDEMVFERGRGRFSGVIPWSTQKMFDNWNGNYLINPSYGEMKRFLEKK